MGNQAQQSRELELWQVVSSTGNRKENTRSTQSRRAGTQTRPDLQRRGNVSSCNRAGAVGSRSAGAVRTRNAGASRNANQIRMISSNTSGTVSRRGGTVRADASRVRAGNTGAARASASRTSRTRAANVARPGYADTSRQRANSPRPTTKAQALKKKKAKRTARINRIFAFIWVVAMSAATVFMVNAFYQSTQRIPVSKAETMTEPDLEDIPVVENTVRKPKIKEDFLTVSEYNRPGTKLTTVKNIFVHYTANQGTSAAQNRSYFENLGQTHERAASAHFIIGYEGEIVQCIPLDEEAYAVVERNGDSISIECCYLEKDGSFTQETYDSLVEMLAWLTDQYDLEPQDILRHYDCGGKLCPIYYVEHEDAWQKLLDDVAHYTL